VLTKVGDSDSVLFVLESAKFQNENRCLLILRKKRLTLFVSNSYAGNERGWIGRYLAHASA
jgi:hypothetical protein